MIGQTFKQQGHGAVVAPLVAEIAQLVEQVAFRLAGDTRVVCISALFILFAMTGSAGLYPLRHGVGYINRGNPGGDCVVGKKQKSDQDNSYHCVLYPFV